MDQFNLISKTTTSRFGEYYSSESKSVYDYDEKGNKIQEDIDSNNDGVVDAVNTYTYDEQDNLIQENFDYNADDTVDSIWTHSYNRGIVLTPIHIMLKVI